MSIIPETRRIDRYRRVNIPADIAADYEQGRGFTVDVVGGDIELTPAPVGDGQTLTGKYRVRLPPSVADQFDSDEQFAVIQDGRDIILRPTGDIDIRL